MNSDLLSIKEFATLCRTTPRTIRFYDLEGLLEPKEIDKFTKYRFYSPLQARDFFKIRLLQNFQIPLKEVSSVLKTTTPHTFLSQNLKTLKEEIDEKQKELKFLHFIKAFLFENTSIQGYFKEEAVGPFTLLCTLKPHGRYDQINTYISKLFEAAKTHNVAVTDKPMYFYVNSQEYKPNNTKLEIAIICKKGDSPPLPEGYYFKKYPQTPMKVFTYKGPFEYITLIYQKIHQGYLGPIANISGGFDMHIKGPWNTKSPYDFVTKLCFPMDSKI